MKQSHPCRCAACRPALHNDSRHGRCSCCRKAACRQATSAPLCALGLQVYSRTPNPGPEFIATQKAVLGELEYPVEEIVDTPQVRRRPAAPALLVHSPQAVS